MTTKTMTSITEDTDLLSGLLVAVGIAAAVFTAGWLLGRQTAPMNTPDPVLDAFLRAPLDPEPLPPEEAAALAEAHAERERGEVVPWSEVRRSARRIPA